MNFDEQRRICRGIVDLLRDCCDVTDTELQVLTEHSKGLLLHAIEDELERRAAEREDAEYDPFDPEWTTDCGVEVRRPLDDANQ